MKKTTRTEKHRIKKSSPFYSTIDELCLKSKNIYNYGNYIIRQEFIKTSKEKEEGLRENANWIRYNELYHLVKDSDAYKDLGSSCAQTTLRKLDKNWVSFFKSIKDYSKCPDKYTGIPHMPKYLDKEIGRFECGLTNHNFKIIDGYIRFSWKPLKHMNGIFKTHIPKESKLLQIRFVPKKGNEYIMEVVYEIEIPETKECSKRIAAIDLGINNLMTITTNCGISPIIINGRPLKSMNQYYNKKLNEKRKCLNERNKQNWSKGLQKLTNKRNNKLDDYIHRATAKAVKICEENNIDTVVCGYSTVNSKKGIPESKDSYKLVDIPTENIISRLGYKLENKGILFIVQEEDFSSGTSFLDKEMPIKENQDLSRRIHRGLFVSNEGVPINADVNASYQIMKKAFPNALDNVECEIRPVILNL